MNRGSILALSTQQPNASRFNEAPIHESGKSRVEPAGTLRARGFNEAPIHESGK